MDQFKQAKEYLQKHFGKIKKPNKHDGKPHEYQECEEYNEFVNSFLKDNAFIPYCAAELATHKAAIEISEKTVKIVEYHPNNQVKTAEITDIDNNRTTRYLFSDRGTLYATFEIDSVGNLVKEIYFFEGGMSYCDENQYDKHNNKIRETRRGYMPHDYKYCYDDDGNLIQKTTLKSDGSVESENIYDRFGNLIKQIKLVNGSINEEKIIEYTDRGLPIIKYTVGRLAEVYRTHREISKHTESFGLWGQYHLKDNASLSLLVTLTESMISFFIKNGYDLLRIRCCGMSEIHCGIIGFDESYTTLEDFVQNALIDYEQKNSSGWSIDFSYIFSRLTKESNTAYIGMRLDSNFAEVQLTGVRAETKLFYAEMLQSISDTTGLDLRYIIVTGRDLYEYV